MQLGRDRIRFCWTFFFEDFCWPAPMGDVGQTAKKKAVFEKWEPHGALLFFDLCPWVGPIRPICVY